MKKFRRKSDIATMLAAVLAMGCGTTGAVMLADADDGGGGATAIATATVYLRNQANKDISRYEFLYEDNGVLCYGTPIGADEKFEWIVSYDGGGRTIKNKATGNCITTDGFADNGYLSCKPYVEDEATFLWEYSVGEESNILASDGRALNLIDVSNGMPTVTELTSVDIGKGYAQWTFLEKQDVNFTALSRDGFVISLGDTAMRMDGNALSAGTPAKKADDAYLWDIKSASGGRSIINRKTGQELTVGGESAWDFEITVDTKISSGEQYLTYDGSFALGADGAAEGTSFSVVPACEYYGADNMGDLKFDSTKDYTFMNGWNNYYLYESENGVPMYGNIDKSDSSAHWNVIYKDGYTAIRNVKSNHYLQLDEEQEPICAEEEVYFFKAERSQSASLKPDSAVFWHKASDGATHPLHIENLTGYAQIDDKAQLRWTSPQWEVNEYVEYSDVGVIGGQTEVPTDWIRLESNYIHGEYLFQSASNAMSSGSKKDSDASSHWKLEKVTRPDKSGDFYHLVNRKSGLCAVNGGTGKIKFVEKSKATEEGAYWTVTSGGKQNTVLIGNVLSTGLPNMDAYLNNFNKNGLAQSYALAANDKSTQWIFTVAPEVSDESAEVNVDINVALNSFEDTNTFKLYKDGQDIGSTYAFEHIANGVRIRNESTKRYLFVNNGSLVERDSDNKFDGRLLWSRSSGIVDKAYAQGGVTLVAQETAKDCEYIASEAQVIDGVRYFTVFAAKRGTYKVDIESAAADGTEVKMAVNGNAAKTVTYPATGIDFALHNGINTITVDGDADISKLIIHDSVNKAYNGASVLYTRYELENAQTNGTILDRSVEFGTIASESSARSAVQLSVLNQYVEVTLQNPANAFVLRASIPDTLDGKGSKNSFINLYIDGGSPIKVYIDTTQSHLYGKFPWTNNPADIPYGVEHVFYSETRMMLDKTYPAGTKFKFQYDLECDAGEYTLDTLETEIVEQAYARPENSISIVDKGADPNGVNDSTQALKDAITEAASSGKEVWIPAGNYDFSKPDGTPIDPMSQKINRIDIPYDNIVIRGAGIWHTTLNGGACFSVSGRNVQFYDLALNGNDVTRNDDRPSQAFSSSGSHGLTVQNCWIEHYKCGMWLSSGESFRIVGNRIRNLFADGINLHSLNNAIVNSYVEQNDFRYTGDDSIASWSQTFKGADNKVLYNSIQTPWLANGIVFYGGKDITIANNYVADTVQAGGGICISTDFTPTLPGGTFKVYNNTLFRCGSLKTIDSTGKNVTSVGAVWINTNEGYNNNALLHIKDNFIYDSATSGMTVCFAYSGDAANISSPGLTSRIVIEGNTIDKSDTYGVYVAEKEIGRIVARNNFITNVVVDNYKNNSKNFVVDVYDKAISVDYSDVGEPTEGDGKALSITFTVIAGVLLLCDIGYLVYLLLKRKEKKNAAAVTTVEKDEAVANDMAEGEDDK